MVREFLVEGVESLGTKSFLEYFPEHAQEDVMANKKSNMEGKSSEMRPLGYPRGVCRRHW
jgi:phytochromobilin:ferredoxin oxidoreductase